MGSPGAGKKKMVERAPPVPTNSLVPLPSPQLISAEWGSGMGRGGPGGGNISDTLAQAQPLATGRCMCLGVCEGIILWFMVITGVAIINYL